MVRSKRSGGTTFLWNAGARSSESDGAIGEPRVFLLRLHTKVGLTSVTKHSTTQGVSILSCGQPALYVCIGNLYFDAADSYENGGAASGGALLADIPNFTNVAPICQISEILTVD